MKGITAFLIIHDEESMVEKCLTSVAKVCDEIVIVHDGPCHDQSLDIARRFTDRITVEEKELKNPELLKVRYLKKHAEEGFFRNEWLLFIDTDEELSPGLVEEIRGLDKRIADAYLIPRRTPAREGETEMIMRLFNVRKVKLFGFYHNSFTPRDGSTRCKALKGCIIHNHIMKPEGERVDWLELEAQGLLTRDYDYYNYSFWQRRKHAAFLAMRKNRLLRRLYRKRLHKNYVRKYSVDHADRKLDYYDKLSARLADLKEAKKNKQ